MTENPLISLGDLTKPATALIEKVSDAVGCIFKPHQIVRVARAEAEADIIRTEAQIKVNNLQRRAMHRFLMEEAQKQSNIESITSRALPLLNEDSSPKNMSNDWVANFFDKCKLISDDDMQKLWSRLLAGEANQPGTFSRQTINLMGDLDTCDAKLFTKLCAFMWSFDGSELIPLILSREDIDYTRWGVEFMDGFLNELQDLGLVDFEPDGLSKARLPKNVSAIYYGRERKLVFPNTKGNSLYIGFANFTRAGKELAPFSGSRAVDGFWEFVIEHWFVSGLIPTTL